MESSIPQAEVYLFIAVGIFLMLLLSIALVVFFNLSQKKLHKEQMNTQEIQLEHQQNMLYAIIEGQEDERRRIAKDLHDEVGSKLNVLFLHLHRLRKKDLQSAQILEISEDLEQLVNTTIDTTRRISHDLLPPTLDNFGLVEGLRELCESYHKSKEIQIDFEVVTHKTPEISKLASVNLFRAAQELIKNSIKHGQASHILLKLSLGFSELKITYRDNGKGFSISRITESKGLGMKNLKSRLDMIGAGFILDSSPGEGVHISIHYPYDI
ncbi:MAG: sensor histidine kinase [Bacteroidota bacterium]